MNVPDDTRPRDDDLWARVLRRFEHTIVFIMTGLLMIIVTVSTAEFGWLLLRDLESIRGRLLDVEQMFELFGYSLLILIGVELISTLNVYLRRGGVHVEVVLEVALIAMAQKVIVLDTARAGGLSLLGLAALILTLAGAFCMMRAARLRKTGDKTMLKRP
jgi:uncharacterized membrane protein (DUF373 family)